MARPATYDGVEFDANLPYDPYSASLVDRARIVSGTDVWVTNEPTMRRRPAARFGDFTGYAFPAAHRVDRLWIYSTVEASPKVYVLASAYDTVNLWWEMFWIRLGAVTPAWTSVTAVRDLNQSTRPHECVVYNGLAYIKGYPGAAADKYGTVVFDGTDNSSTVWGYPGPTAGADATAQGGWAASTGNYVINSGWVLAYSYVTKTGHVTSRSPLIAPTGQNPTTPVLTASSSGSFTNLKPAWTYTGDADITNIPSIQFWRTTDGGSVFTALERNANPGGGVQTYIDDSAGGDPVTDFALNAENFGPDESTNDPPPPVDPEEGDTIGTTQVSPSTRIEEWAGRLWYAIGNKLFFSGDEEVINGKPAESWPSGTTEDYTVSGNFIKFRDKVRQVLSTSDGLYVVTDTLTVRVEGTNRSNFFVRTVSKQLGASRFQLAGDSSENVAAWLTQEGRLAVVQGGTVVRPYLSDPIHAELAGELSTCDEVDVRFHFQDEHDWLTITTIDRDTPGNSRIHVYDLTRKAWNTPWALDVSAVAPGVPTENTEDSQFLVATWDGSQARVGALDLTSSEDDLQAAASGWQSQAVLNLSRVSAGNQVNLRTQPAVTPRLMYVVAERTAFGGDTDPTLEYRLDADTGAWTTPTLEPPPYRAQSAGYNSLWGAVNKRAARAQLRITSQTDTNAFEIQKLALMYDPTTVG